MNFAPGRWITVLVFSGCGLLWRRGTSDPQPVGRQRAGGRIACGCLAVSRGARVAAACAGTARTMGVLPAGSGNDYVKALGVGTGLRRALEVLVGGKVRVVDTAEVNGVPFNNGLGIGFDAEVAAGVARAPAYLGGAGRYLWSVARLLEDFRCHEARLVIDGDVVEAKTILVAVALGTTYGSLFRLAPGAVLDDGLFDVIWSEEVNRVEV